MCKLISCFRGAFETVPMVRRIGKSPVCVIPVILDQEKAGFANRANRYRGFRHQLFAGVRRGQEMPSHVVGDPANHSERLRFIRPVSPTPTILFDGRAHSGIMAKLPLTRGYLCT